MEWFQNCFFFLFWKFEFFFSNFSSAYKIAWLFFCFNVSINAFATLSCMSISLSLSISLFISISWTFAFLLQVPWYFCAFCCMFHLHSFFISSDFVFCFVSFYFSIFKSKSIDFCFCFFFSQICFLLNLFPFANLFVFFFLFLFVESNQKKIVPCFHHRWETICFLLWSFFYGEKITIFGCRQAGQLYSFAKFQHVQFGEYWKWIDPMFGVCQHIRQ